MKIHPLFLVCALVLSGCSMHALDREIFSVGIKNLPPLLENIVSKTVVGAKSDIPYYTSLYALDEQHPVALLKPYQECRDRYVEFFDHTKLPLVLFVYDDSTRTRRIGVAHDVLTVRTGHVATWHVTRNHVQFFDARTSWGDSRMPVHPLSKAVEPIEVDFPRIEVRSTTIVQYVNGTLFQVPLVMNGSLLRVVEPGSFIVLEETNYQERRYQGVFSGQVVDQGFVRGQIPKRDFSIGPFPGGPYVYQFVLTPNDIRGVQ